MVEELDKHPRVTVRGLIFLFGAALLAGILIGGLASLIGRFIYLIILFPIAMGLASGFVVKSVVVSEKIRSPLVVILAGIFAALVVYGSMHFFDYFQFRSAVAKEVQAQVVAEYGEEAPDENVQEFIDYILVEETGSSGFIGFILLEAEEGVSISPVGPGSMGNDSGINLGAFTWLYWLVEIGIIGWASINPGYQKTRDLFCEHCNAWVGDSDHIGGFQPESFQQAADLINRRDFVGLAKMLRHDTTLPSFEFYTRTCKTCNTFPLYLTGVAVSAGNKGQTQSKLFVAQLLNSSERYALTTELGSPTLAK